MTTMTRATEAKVELKICERCGGLWLRPANSGWIYCALCHKEVSALPPSKPRRKGGDVPADTTPEAMGGSR